MKGWKIFTAMALAGVGSLWALRLQGADPEGMLFPYWEEVPPAVYYPYADRPALQQLLSARHPDFRRFLEENPGPWLVRWNEATQTPHRLLAAGLRLDLEAGSAPALAVESDEAAAAAARRLLGRHPGLFPVDPQEDLRFDGRRDLGRSQLWRFSQYHGALPVWSAGCDLVVSASGRVLSIKSDLIPRKLLSSLPADPLAAEAAIDPQEAVQAARDHAGGAGGLESYRPPRTRLVILPVPVTRGRDGTIASPPSPAAPGARVVPCLAWEVAAASMEDGTAWTYFIAALKNSSAHSETSSFSPPREAAILGRFNRVSFGDLKGSVKGWATPGLFPDTPWNPPVAAPLPHLQVVCDDHSIFTNADGSFALNIPEESAVLSTFLSGPYCRVENAGGEELFYSTRITTALPVTIALNETPEEQTTAQINAFVEVNRAHDFVKSLDPAFTELDRPVRTRVNLTERCNASFFPEGEGYLAFFRSNACVNTAYSTIIYHEYAHFVIWSAFSDKPIMPAYSEGMADGLVVLMTDQPVIGAAINGLRGDGSLNVRDLSQAAVRYPDDLFAGPHLSGQIIGGLLWELRNRLVARLGPEAGRSLLQQLYLKSLYFAPPLISPDLVIDFLILDDDDDDLFNGTPHQEDLLQSFAKFGLFLPDDLTIQHDPLSDTSQGGPYLVEAKVSSNFEFIQIGEVKLHYSLNGGGFYHAVPMQPTLRAGTFRGEIPNSPPATTVHYYLEARGEPFDRAVLPEGAPQEEAFVFAVGKLEAVHFDSFSTLESNWNHGLLLNADPPNEDDWQLGSIGKAVESPEDLIDGDLLDPPAAFSPPYHWGNDLALDNRSNKTYSDLAHNFLESPPLDCRGKHGLHLRFRRWLTAERHDNFLVSVNGRAVFLSSSDRDTFDRAWRLMDYDISGQADNRAEVRLRFEVHSNSFGTAGGWNIDDVSLIATGTPEIPRPALTSIEPSFDGLKGGAPFILKGANFTPTQGTRIFFGEAEATVFQVVNGAAITGTVPPGGRAGTTTIVLDNAAGSTTLPGSFAYFGPPEVESFVPPKGDVAGGMTVGIQGKYFTPGGTTRIWLDGKPLEPLTFVDAAVVLGRIPPGRDLGVMGGRIESAFGASSFKGLFIYTAKPLIDQIAPKSGSVEGGTLFFLIGANIPSEPGAASVLFGERYAEGITVISRSLLRGLVPRAAGRGPVDVHLQTPGGTARLARAYTYVRSGSPVFIRMDVNLDGQWDISDPIVILNSLFLGLGTIYCRDAADSNDDGSLDISDAIYAFWFLYSIGRPPP
ncbi:MAG: IPT/TIG domain-containing protein, partial [Planctomycetes bacterium]|nr:IPT/TIG domain-containing protein [Planctomycetota bacterium]